MPVNDLNTTSQKLTEIVSEEEELIEIKRAELNALINEVNKLHNEMNALRNSKIFSLREAATSKPFGIRKFLRLGFILSSFVLPEKWSQMLASWGVRILNAKGRSGSRDSNEAPYQVKVPVNTRSDAPKVVHVIANFKTGGSSRLVVDLIEYLGGECRQSVLTSYIPSPPAYLGIDIEECRYPSSIVPFVNYYRKVRPDFVHVHYWGDCDEPWYGKAIEAAKQLNLPVIQNINTPVSPYYSDAVVKYVYVSDYVKKVFGMNNPQHITIYPGSDFRMFSPSGKDEAGDCVGMVYRLERDKLNEDAIQPFIHIAKLRPQTKILIVGGGSLLEPFRMAVKENGVASNFEFTDYVSYDSLPGLYRRMNVFIAPVWKESFGQVSPFAMNMQIPVIGYDVGAIGEIVNNETLLAPPGDAAKLAKIAVDLLDDPDGRKKIGMEQQRRAQDYFSIEAMIESYAKLYAEMENKYMKETA